MDKVVGYVYETFDYDKFKKLLGNRDILEPRVNKIVESINAVGYVKNPVVVNGQMGTIDGQGRIEACKRLGLPVYYTVDESAGIDQCIQLNISSTAWTTKDYVQCYKQQGNENYENLFSLMEDFPNISIDVISFAVSGRGMSNDTGGVRKGFKNRNKIVSGAFICTEKDREDAYRKLDYAQKFLFKTMNGTTKFFLTAVIFAAFYAGANQDRLYKKLYECQQEIVPFTNVSTALNSIGMIYNKKIHGKRIDFVHEYIAFCDSKVSNYSARWVNEKKEGNVDGNPCFDPW